VSALVLNFVPDKPKALAEMRRVCRPNGTVAFYVWDYPSGGVEFIRAFWQAATTLDPDAQDLTEDKRFPYCTREGLSELVTGAGLKLLGITQIEVATTFKDFADYWQPFTLGTGPAPGYCMSLGPEARERLRSKLADALPRELDGSIKLRGRSWAVKAIRNGGSREDGGVLTGVTLRERPSYRLAPCVSAALHTSGTASDRKAIDHGNFKDPAVRVCKWR
jgi:hypothetical protein